MWPKSRMELNKDKHEALNLCSNNQLYSFRAVGWQLCRRIWSLSMTSGRLPTPE